MHKLQTMTQREKARIVGSRGLIHDFQLNASFMKVQYPQQTPTLVQLILRVGATTMHHRFIHNNRKSAASCPNIFGPYRIAILSLTLI